ncbi:class I SAM-dependent methyltransferase [Actinoplanes sp. NEAU-A12]|uniref:Class I SAM-dependent methyltransferase n=1 Tax=Actinoplanes sandaracinus TaxID=3045177 RepID=A0ABT6WGK5_9ACTN|nr:class I SAM-dependent methyltransferase [Actinoplanes sandaracinus]MDI6098863.1 class I SAM-dependent methyltransferase [Actinoplanes sandaracinus]
MTEEPQQIVARGYDAVAHSYAALERDAPWPRLAWLDDLLTRLPDAAHVLDLGCGNGLPAGERIARRHRLTGVDVSARQIELARANVPGGEFSTGDILRLRHPDGTFAAVTAFYTFDHLPRERLPEMFQLIHGWLAASGYLLCCVEIEDQPGTVANWLGAPMYFSSYDPDTTRALLTGAGFEIVRDAIEKQTEGGHEVGYLWLLARKCPE